MRLRCTVCREYFPWDPTKGWPEDCPVNHCYIGMGDRDDVVLPFISQKQNLGADRVYRDMEQKSALRAKIAQEQYGLSSEDAAQLKMTNMRDNLREGDVAAMPVRNEVTRLMDTSPSGTVGMSTMGVQLSQGTRVGPVPRAGTNFIESVLKPGHRRDAAEALAGSIANNHRGKSNAGNT